MKKIDVLKDESSNVMLLDEERQQLRESLLAYIEKTPVLPTAQLEENIEVKNPSRRTFFLSVMAGIVIAGAGVSYVADRATPGSLLYPIKVGVNDRVRAFGSSSSLESAAAVDQTDLMAPAVVSASSTQE